MDDGKTQTIFLSIIGIATLLVAIFLGVVSVATLIVAIIGATFAWFSITVTGNENPSDIVITSGTLGQVSFVDGTNIEIDNLMPGNYTTKTFTISQTDPSATGKISYNIVLNVKSNTLTPAANNEFVHSLKASGSGVIEGYEVHTYEYTIGLNNANFDQNEAQGKTFSGYLSVVLTNEGLNQN